MQPAIFLDRDGVIIENRSDYVRSWADVEIFPFAVRALAQYASSPYKIVFITNQSAVGRGIISLEAAEEINRKILIELEKYGCRVDGIFMCPHAPGENCSCRKPLPGLLHQAARSLSIDLPKSVMIGDAWTDLQAGQAAGIQNLALVRTGRGKHQLKMPAPPELSSASIFDTLAEALSVLMPQP